MQLDFQLFDRATSFRLFLEALPDNPLILEIGCVRGVNDLGAGMSTLIFGEWCRERAGRLTSVDIDKGNCDFAKIITTGLPVDVVNAHSHEYLASYHGPHFHGVYLDGMDTDIAGCAESALIEARLASSLTGLILIDDVADKGKLAVPWLQAHGYTTMHAGYQALMRRNF